MRAPLSCWSRWASAKLLCPENRETFLAVSGSGSVLRGHWRWSRMSSSRMKASRHLTFLFRNKAIFFFTHDLRVAAQIADYITVMQIGGMVEFGPAEEVFSAPKHPYTQRLLEAAPGKDWHPPRLSREKAAEIAAGIERV